MNGRCECGLFTDATPASDWNSLLLSIIICTYAGKNFSFAFLGSADFEPCLWAHLYVKVFA